MESNEQIKVMHAILNENVAIAEHASLTGTLKKSRGILVGTYNRIYAALKAQNLVDETILTEASPEISMDEIGVFCRYLVRMLELRFPDLNLSRSREVSHAKARSITEISKMMEDLERGSPDGRESGTTENTPASGELS